MHPLSFASVRTTPSAKEFRCLFLRVVSSSFFESRLFNSKGTAWTPNAPVLFVLPLYLVLCGMFLAEERESVPEGVLSGVLPDVIPSHHDYLTYQKLF